MPSRIDDKTLVPLGMVILLLSTVVGVSVPAAFWVKGVNDRLSRIEDKLGIAQMPSGPINEAQAGEK